MNYLQYQKNSEEFIAFKEAEIRNFFRFPIFMFNLF